nr:MipA/OmpV family protein [uncultured Holophaga sp.]
MKRTLIPVLLGLTLTAGEPPRDRWSVDLGLMALAGPDSPGSDGYQLRALPLLQARRDIFSLGAIEGTGGVGLGVRVLRRGPFSFDLALSVSPGRKAHRSEVLAGMGDQPWMPWAVATGSWRRGSLKASLTLLHALPREGGQRAQLSVEKLLMASPHWVITARGSLVLADATALEREFGVDAGQALRRSALTQGPDAPLRPGEDRTFSPGSGLRDIQVGLGLIHRQTRTLSLMGGLSATRFSSRVSESPLVRRNTDFAFTTGLLWHLP